jgi:excisionase family DNA binding protein
MAYRGKMQTDKHLPNSHLKFFTSLEIAEILKMNPQVIARKLQAGEMEGYKLGKDWRVSEAQLLRFLERHSNANAPKTPEGKVVGNFIQEGKLSSIPAARGKRLAVLKHLVAQLDPQKIYDESEINKFLAGFHSDVCTLRREFIINKLMVRKNGKYKVVGWHKP